MINLQSWLVRPHCGVRRQSRVRLRSKVLGAWCLVLSAWLKPFGGGVAGRRGGGLIEDWR